MTGTVVLTGKTVGPEITSRTIAPGAVVVVVVDVAVAVERDVLVDESNATPVG